MASYLFSNSPSSSEHDEFNYDIPICRKPVRRTLNVDVVDVESYIFNGKSKIDVDDIMGKMNMNVNDNIGGKKNENVDKMKMDVDHIGGKKNENVDKMKMKVDDNIGGKEDDNMDKMKMDVDDNIGVEEDDADIGFGENGVPYVGMIFNTLKEVEKFYGDYGRNVGFEIIIRNTHNHARSKDPSSRMYICKKGGRLDKKKKTVSLKTTGKRKRVRDAIPRTGCKARIFVVHITNINKWKITVVELEHNHGMVAPENIQFFKRSRNIDDITRSLIEQLNKSGIETSKVMKYLSETVGGVENLGFSNQEIRNVIRDIRRRVFDSGDAECGLALLRELEAKSCDKFFYQVDVDDENRVRGLVWVDHRCMNAYKNFGDVVTFDSTYRTNRYCMPFIPITGVNHHFQNILFGFALIRDEKETSYKWVLNTWLKAVDNIPPTTIITDQDIALGNAIAEVMPQTKHTYCTWHISQKFPEKLGPLYTKYPEFKGEFNECVYKSLSSTEFEGRWEVLVKKYHLKDHNWLNELYAIRVQWIRAYTKKHFAAGMTTTSRSESMNAFFDEYVQASTGLREFIENSQKALVSQYINEVKEDFESDYKERSLLLNSPLEIHASKIYTKVLFGRFQKELLKSQSYTVKSVKEGRSDKHKLYLVEKFNLLEDNRKTYRLTVDFECNGLIQCSCKKFEHSGMMCKHMMKYLEKKQKTMIPNDYIKPRWTMDGNRMAGPLPYTPPVLANVGQSQPARYSALSKSFQRLSAIGSSSFARYNYLMGVIEKEINYVSTSFPEEEKNERMFEGFSQEGQHDPVFDPPMSQTKGRKKEGRMKSGIETSSSSKPRKCSGCNKTGQNHDFRNCPQRKT